jgi:hypothetical protein
MTTAGRDRRSADGVGERREANDAGRIPLDQPVPPLLALQQTAGNAAVSRLVARSRLLLRDDAPGTPAPSGGAAPAAAGSNPVLEMAKTAWDTGVTQREQDTAKKLQQPQAGKPELTDAVTQLTEAMGAADSIGTQVGALDPARKTRSDVHFNAILGSKNMAVVALGHNSPAEIGQHISTDVESSQSAISDMTKPLSTAPGSSSGGSPSASNPGSAGTGGAAAAAETAAAGTN